MELTDDPGDIGLVNVFLETLIDDVNGVVLVPEVIDALDREAGFKFLEDLPADDFKAFARLVILIDGHALHIKQNVNGRV